MIIKLIPETEAERNNMQEEELVGVKDFFIFGAKQEEDGVADFHNWRGNHRYLLGGLTYFYEVINDERREKNMMNLAHKAPVKNKMKKTAPVENVQILDFPKNEDINVTHNIPEPPAPGFALDNGFDIEK